MKILVTTLAIALTIGTAIAALHPPGESVREDKQDKPAASMAWWWIPPGRDARPWEEEEPVRYTPPPQPVHYNYTPPPSVMPIPVPPPTPVKTTTYRETNTDPVTWNFPAPPRPVKTISMRNPHAPPFTQTFGHVPVFTGRFQ